MLQSFEKNKLSLMIIVSLFLCSLSCQLGGASENSLTADMLLGKAADSAAVKKFIKENHCTKGVVYGNYMCKTVGVELGLYGTDQVSSVMLFSGRIDDFDVYRGKLPYNLTWQDTITTVDQKLGQPTESGTGLDIYHLWYYYAIYGLWIYFDTLSATDIYAPVVEVKVDLTP